MWNKALISGKQLANMFTNTIDHNADDSALSDQSGNIVGTARDEIGKEGEEKKTTLIEKHAEEKLKNTKRRQLTFIKNSPMA